MRVQFWFDPACPWCWLTSRWLVDEVAPHRELEIDWQPISLYFLNEPDPDSDHHDPLLRTTKLLRIVESMRAGGLQDRLGDVYTAFGRRIHHDEDREFDPVSVLEELGVPAAHGEAFDNDSWDREIRARHDDGVSLVGDDVGTPIIAYEGPTGRVGLFGPVLSVKPTGDDALRLWDGFRAITETDGFWELKRTRTEGPQL